MEQEILKVIIKNFGDRWQKGKMVFSGRSCVYY